MWRMATLSALLEYSKIHEKAYKFVVCSVRELYRSKKKKKNMMEKS